jgi:hypothetical protein
LHEGFGIETGLLENGSRHGLQHIARVVGDSDIAIQGRIEPDIVRTGGLTVEFEAERLEPSDNVAIAESGRHAIRVATISG